MLNKGFKLKNKNVKKKERKKDILKATFGKVVRVLKGFHIPSVNNS